MINRFFVWARSKRLEILIFCSMAGLYFFANFQRGGVPGTVFDELQKDFNAKAGQITALASIFLYVYASVQIFIGAGADRFGPAKMVLTGGALLTVGSILFPLCHTLPMLYLCRALVGLGASFMYLSIVKEIVNIFDSRHFAQILGVLLVLGYSGGLVAMAPLQRFVAAYGWRSAFLGAGFACAAVFVFVAALLKKTGHMEHSHSTLSSGAVMELLRTRSIYPLLVCGPVNFALYYVLQITVGKKFLQDHCGLASDTAADVMFAMFLIVVIGSLVGGFLPGLIGNRRRPFVVATSAIAVLGTLALVTGMFYRAEAWWFVSCYLVLALLNATAVPGTALLKEVSPHAAGAFAIGISNAATYTCVALFSNGAGFALDSFEESARKTATATIYPAEAYQWMFVGMLVFALASLAASLLAPESHGKQRGAEAAVVQVAEATAAD